MPSKLTLDEVNKFCYTDFIANFGNVVERAPVIAGAAWSEGPFRSVDHLQQIFSKHLGNLPKEYKRGILRCLPELGGKMAREGRVSQESMEEQSSTGLLDVDNNHDLARNIQKLGSAYRKKFKFHFVICARENKMESILAGLLRRIRNEEEEEIEIAIREIMKITGYRILNLVDVNAGELISKF